MCGSYLLMAAVNQVYIIFNMNGPTYSFIFKILSILNAILGNLWIKIKNKLVNSGYLANHERMLPTYYSIALHW